MFLFAKPLLVSLFVSIVLSLGLYGLWQHNRFLSVQLEASTEALKNVTEHVEKLSNSMTARDAKNALNAKRMLEKINEVGKIPDDGCLDKQLNVDVLRVLSSPSEAPVIP